jgi:hypothetical protein
VLAVRIEGVLPSEVDVENVGRSRDLLALDELDHARKRLALVNRVRDLQGR